MQNRLFAHVHVMAAIVLAIAVLQATPAAAQPCGSDWCAPAAPLAAPSPPAPAVPAAAFRAPAAPGTVLPAEAGAPTFSGSWSTEYGVVELVQTGQNVTGSYFEEGGSGTLVGHVTGNRLDFRWNETGASGDAYFELSADGQSFVGYWRSEDDTEWASWDGRREGGATRPVVSGSEGPFSGLYETEWGRLRLLQGADGRVTGQFAGGGHITGQVEGTRLSYQYEQGGESGSGWFDLGAEGRTLNGSWSFPDGSDGGIWSGVRVDPEPGVVWLVVLETQWETGLNENEYSFGEMLEAYFERLPQVRVRHRRINDPEDFDRAAEEVALLAEPVALWLSSHGSAGSLTLEGGEVHAQDIGRAIASADNVFLLHFAACEMMVPGVTESVRAALPAGRDLVMSGYAVSVDWGASAAFEFLYLDLVLGRGLAPREAAAVLRSELNFVGDTETSGSPLGALQFRME